jgi:hypothetical protein
MVMGGKVADVITTKLFRNGGSLAVRIPAGWVSEGEITLSRDVNTGRIFLSQDQAFDPNSFFDFVASRGFVRDEELLQLAKRDESPRSNALDAGE